LRNDRCGFARVADPGKEAADDCPYLIGAIALFVQGIHGESHDREKFEPAEFAFPIHRALPAGLKSSRIAIDGILHSFRAAS